MNQKTKGKLYIHLVDWNPSCIELLLWTLLQMDTITISCTKHYWHPQKRAIRMHSWTPSLGDGGLVHFSGPRLIGYKQLPLSPIVVTPTKVFLQNSILSLVHPHIVIQNKTLIKRSIHQRTTDRTLNLIWQEVIGPFPHYLHMSQWWMGVPCFNSLLQYSGGLLMKGPWSTDPIKVAFWLEKWL